MDMPRYGHARAARTRTHAQRAGSVGGKEHPSAYIRPSLRSFFGTPAGVAAYAGEAFVLRSALLSVHWLLYTSARPVPLAGVALCCMPRRVAKCRAVLRLAARDRNAVAWLRTAGSTDGDL